MCWINLLINTTLCILLDYIYMSVHSCELQKHIYVHRLILKYIGGVTKSIQTECTSLVPYTALWQNFSEHVLTFSCMSSISKASLQPFNQTQSLQVNSSGCVTLRMQGVWEYGIVCVCVCKICSQPKETDPINWWNNLNCILREDHKPYTDF